MSAPRVAFVSGTGCPPHGAMRSQRSSENAPPWYLWRLLSSNNRELGRSVMTFDDLDSAVVAVELLRTAVDRAEISAVRIAAPARWRWELRLDGAFVAAGSRSYQRLRECQSSAAGFVASLGDAVIQTHPSQLVHQRRVHAPALAILGHGSGARR